jgi:hypothetical protein
MSKNIILVMILQRVDPLPGDDRETNEATAVAAQQIINKQQLKNREERRFLSGPCRDVITRTVWSNKSVCEEKAGVRWPPAWELVNLSKE